MDDLALKMLQYVLLWVNSFYLGWLTGYDPAKDRADKLHQNLLKVIFLNIAICAAYLLIKHI